MRTPVHRRCVVAAGIGLVLVSTVTASDAVSGTWVVEHTPNPSGTFNELDAVTAGHGGVWAVGGTKFGKYSGSTRDRTLILKRTSSGWIRQPSPNRSDNNSLAGVVAISQNNAWAVGQHHKFGGQGVLVLHWNGTAWQRHAAPHSGYSSTGLYSLHGIAAASARNVWAVGDQGPNDTSQRSHAFIEHWNGAAWKVQPSPTVSAESFLTSVTAIDGSHAWAVGGDNAGRKSLVLRWNGTSWRQLTVPHPGLADSLYGVVALSRTNVWAVGGYLNRNNRTKTLILHHTATGWQRIATPNATGSVRNYLDGVVAVSGRSIWAVGSHDGQTLIEHYNGTAWTIAPSPSVAGYGNELSGVAASTDSSLVAVGHYITDTTGTRGYDKTLALHCC